MGEKMGRLEKFFETYENRNTIRGYRLALKKFFGAIYGEGNLEEHAERYFGERRNYEDDVKGFYSFIKNKSPSTVSSGLSYVKNFLSDQGVELPERFWKRLRGRKKGNRALTQDRVPTIEEMRRILSHMGAKGRALYLMLASSGMRIGECLKLKIVDVDLTTNPPKVKIKGAYTKSGNSRLAFISQEAKEVIQEWLKIRDAYIVAAVKKSVRYGKSDKDERLFPFENTVGYLMWASAIKKAGFITKDSETKRYELHPHVLRKFFRTRLSSVMRVDIVEALMGHEGYLTQVYRRHSEDDLAKFYLEGEHALAIFSETGDLLKRSKEITDKSIHLGNLVDGLVTENLKLKKEMCELKEGFLKLHMTVKKFELNTKEFLELQGKGK